MCVLFFMPDTPGAAPENGLNGPEKGIAEPDASSGISGYDDPYEALEASYRRALAVETTRLAYLSDRIESTEAHAVKLSEAYASHHVMISNHASMLVESDVDLQRFSMAHMRQQAGMDVIGDTLEGLLENKHEFELLQAQTNEQLEFYTRQIDNIKAQPPSIPLDQSLLDPLDLLIETLDAKRVKLEQLIDHYTRWSNRYRSLEGEVEQLAARYETLIQKREQEQVLIHKSNPLVRIAEGELFRDIETFWKEMRDILSARFWYKPEAVSWQAYAVFFVTFLVFFLGIEGLLYLLARYLGIVKQQMLEQQYFYRFLMVKLLHRSLLIMGAIAFLYLYPVSPIYRLTPFFVLFPVFIQVLFLLLGVQWVVILLRGLRMHIQDHLFIRLTPLFRVLLGGIFLFVAFYIVVQRFYCSDCLLLIVLRLLGQSALLVWMAYFLWVFHKNAEDCKLARYAWFEKARIAVIVIGFGSVLPGFLAEVSGYGGMADLWFFGLWRTFLILMWAWILLGFLKEADVPMYIEKSDDLSEDQFEEQPYPVRWLIVRVARLTLAGVLVFSLPLAWGADRTFWADFLRAINFRVKLGDFEFSAVGVLYAVVVILIVYTISVLWKSLLRNRFLLDAEMEEGLKDSITRISVYGVWGVGLVVAMQMLGVSGTSLAVVIGALGIGLGFGLQSIFKDFISGIILLFERPVQVGDVLEIDGMWATVKQINVRATYVKTYDNSDVIIPNADFINRQVINWSFRDPRIRRKIQVRVAYGSDIKQVKETLMNIAYRHPQVLRRPYPEVYFKDLGESAMVFELRIWIHVNHFIIVETDVRDDISSQFREAGIRIAFPQQDVYIRQAPSSFGGGSASADAPQKVPADGQASDEITG